MKIAISSTGEKLTDKVSEIFARCPYFIIAEIEDRKVERFEAMKNQGESQLGQAGISAAQLMAEKDIKAVIAKNVGPRASDVLRQFNIEVYHGDGAIEEILQKFTEGKLKKIT